jgi:hypothetical protein
VNNGIDVILELDDTMISTVAYWQSSNHDTLHDIVFDNHVWTGATDHYTVGDTCNDWDSSSSGDTGMIYYEGNAITIPYPFPCDNALQVLCLAAPSPPSSSISITPTSSRSIGSSVSIAASVSSTQTPSTAPHVGYLWLTSSGNKYGGGQVGSVGTNGPNVCYDDLGIIAQLQPGYLAFPWVATTGSSLNDKLVDNGVDIMYKLDDTMFSTVAYW